MGPVAHVALDFLLEEESPPDYVHGVYIRAKLKALLEQQGRLGPSASQHAQRLFRAVEGELIADIGGAPPVAGLHHLLFTLDGRERNYQLDGAAIWRAAHHHAEMVRWAKGHRVETWCAAVTTDIARLHIRDVLRFEGPYFPMADEFFENWISFTSATPWAFPYRQDLFRLIKTKSRADLVQSHGIVSFVTKVGRKMSEPPKHWTDAGWQRLPWSATVYRLPDLYSAPGGTYSWPKCDGGRLPEREPLPPNGAEDAPLFPQGLPTQKRV